MELIRNGFGGARGTAGDKEQEAGNDGESEK
jgi:hypothetical protein